MNKENCPLISIITTVYNTEKYVERCFDSIMKQTYQNIEFIVVNNASSGNIEEIVEDYRSAYPERTIKLVTLENNVGLFHGRLCGAEIATGEYIAFIDSDDRVSIDFYRLLLKKAHTCKADMVATDFVYEDENGNLTRDIYNPMPTLDFEYNGSDIMEHYLNEAATSFYWNLIWNKIYSKELWRKSLPYLKENSQKIVMCDDIAFTVVLHSQAKKYVNIHSPKYYYLRRSDANSLGNGDYKRFNSIIEDIVNVFNFFETFVLKIKGEVALKQISAWKERYYRIWASGIDYETLPSVQKRILKQKLGNGLLSNEKTTKENPEDRIFWNKSSAFNDGLEHIKSVIADPTIEVVSFDVFDTLIKRNIWEPFDLFQFMDKKFTELSGATTFIEFSKIRSYCECEAQKKLPAGKELTLHQIYQEIQEEYQFSPSLISAMETYETELEMTFCKARQTGKELFEMAQHLNKRIVCISDMYLSAAMIKKLLNSCGYNGEYDVFVSSEVGLTKANGKLFKYAFNNLKIANLKAVVHIGDNYGSDVLGAKKAGICGLHLPKIQMVFCDAVQNIQAGKLFANAFVNRQEAYYNNTIFQYLGTRCFMALVINKFFDDPFVHFMEETEFNADPCYIGYFCLGFYMLEMCWWIDKIRCQEGYQKLHFVSRDGYLLKQCYETMYPDVNTNYLYTSRDAMLSLFFEHQDDVLGFSYLVYPLNYSPEKLLEIFSPFLCDEYEKAENILRENDFIPERKFASKEECDRFILFYVNRLLDREKLMSYRAEMRAAFRKIIAPNECTIDVGYSGRPESILTKLLGYPVDALYMFSNADKAVVNSSMQKFKVFSNREYFPGITNEILLELLISDTENSCKNLILKNGTLEPIYKTNKQNYSTSFFIQCAQKAALDFVNDYKKYLSAFEDQLYKKEDDLRYPLEYFLKRAPQNDFSFLAAAYFDDNMDESNLQTLQNLRGYDLAISTEVNIKNHVAKDKFAKAIYYLFYDHVSLKAAVKRRLKNHPILFYISKRSYKSFKAVSSAFRH